MTVAPESTPRLPAPALAQRTAWHRVRTSTTRREWTRAGGKAALILALHVIGWFTLVAPRHHAIGTQTFGVGIGVTACTLGMRHAFDADHRARQPRRPGRHLDVARIEEKWSGGLAGPEHGVGP
jgi:high-affinity nickel-transport protein